MPAMLFMHNLFMHNSVLVHILLQLMRVPGPGSRPTGLRHCGFTEGDRSDEVPDTPRRYPIRPRTQT